MREWIYSNNRKKHQRKLNRHVRALNKMIEEDNLWRGRFVVQQLVSQFLRWEDKSGGQLHSRFIIGDKKTGKYMETGWLTVNEAIRGRDALGWQLNDFIGMKINVWRENPGPREQTEDFRNVKFKKGRPWYEREERKN